MVLSFIGEILSKIRRGVLENTRISEEDSIYFIPVGLTTVTHVYHVDKAQLMLYIGQCTWNLHSSQQKVTQ